MKDSGQEPRQPHGKNDACHGLGGGRPPRPVHLPGVKAVVAVGSGKGGVGKSTVACNLAACLAREGAKTGLLDADVYGPNVPQMMGLPSSSPAADREGGIEPFEAFGVKVMSMGFFVDQDAPVIWRGPMVHGAVVKLLGETAWGSLDCLVVDLPPGTGDAQITLCQSVPVAGALLVTTPQGVALSDVAKALVMFRSLEVPILGLVENMAEFACPHCGKASRIFSEGGARSLGQRAMVPVLASIPLETLVCEAGDKGAPVSVSRPDSAAAKAFRALARRVAAEVKSAAERRGRGPLHRHAPPA